MKNKFAERIKEIRLEKKLSQAKFAELLNVGQRCVSGWECNNAEPSFDTLLLISEIFNVSLDYLLGKSDYE